MHTEGPLFVKASAALCSHNGDVGVVNKKGTLIAVAISRPTEGEALANARLFAASPELLEAAEPFATFNSSDEFITVRTADVTRLRVAIAKARGAA